jgi:carbon-monoxide dehydrogenase medium subunit
MIPAPFEYEVAESADQAVELLGHYGSDAKLIAGGHSLLPLMRLRLAHPNALVDIGRLTHLSFVREEGDKIAIGALTTHDDVQHNDLLRSHCGIVAQAAGRIGDPQVRHRGTIGGSISHGDPASDLPAVLLALDAEFVVRGPTGDRIVGARDFFKDFLQVDLSQHEIVTEIRVPKLDGRGWSYLKFSPRAQDWAVVGVAAILHRSNGSIDSASVGLASMGTTPLRASGVEEALTSGAAVEDAAQEASRDTSPPSDQIGSAEYRTALVKVLTKRALEEALTH